MSDEMLMEQAQAGKLDALGTLFERYHQPVYGFFVRLTGNLSLSEDLTQMTFERLLRYHHSYRGDGSFRAWLFRMARNVRADHYRSERIRVDRQVEINDLPLLCPSVAHPLEQKERVEALQAAIEALPDTYRETFLLVWQQELKYREVAELLGTTETNVKSRIHRAIRVLRSSLTVWIDK